jgi:hypothetical protein
MVRPPGKEAQNPAEWNVRRKRSEDLHLFKWWGGGESPRNSTLTQTAAGRKGMRNAAYQPHLWINIE